MSQNGKILWQWVFLVAFGTLVLLVLAHVLFVAFYAHLMDPGHDQAYYSQFAQRTGAPFVFFFAPLPTFLLARWVGRKSRPLALVHAALIVAIFLLLDLSITVLAGSAAYLLQPAFLLTYATKIIATLLGGWSAKREAGRIGTLAMPVA